MLSRFDRLNIPASLAPVLQYARRGTSFWLCLERARLEYYRGNNDALRTQCDSVDAVTACPDAMKQAPLAQTPAERAQLAKYRWHNCMNEVFHQSYGQYPHRSWRAFLEEFAIEETMISSP
jgi:hypothetical protein